MIVSKPPVSAKACHKAKRSVGYRTSCHILGRECPEAVLPDRALYSLTLSHLLSTLSHLFIVNKLLSLERPVAVSPGRDACTY